MMHFAVKLHHAGGLWQAECTSVEFGGFAFSVDLDPAKAMAKALVDFRNDAGIDLGLPNTVSIKIPDPVSYDLYARHLVEWDKAGRPQ